MTTLPHSSAVEVLLLAAGRSRRMAGVDKLMLPLREVPLLRATALLYRSLGLELTVVLQSADGPQAAALAGLEVRIAVNADPPGAHGADFVGDDGQQASVRIGLGAAAIAGRALLIALADQPLLEPADITALIAHFDAAGGQRMVVPRHAGQRGNPVILPAALARALRDDPAAPTPRQWADGHPQDIAWFDGNAHFIRDIDTPADARALLGGQGG